MNSRTKLRVLRRDRWWCMMPVCLHSSRVIVQGLPHDDPWAGTVDHVIPKSYGGSDCGDNLRAAHRLCNEKRGSGSPVSEGIEISIMQLRQRDLKLKGVARGPAGGVLRGPRGGLLADPQDVLGPHWSPG